MSDTFLLEYTLQHPYMDGISCKYNRYGHDDVKNRQQILSFIYSNSGALNSRFRTDMMINQGLVRIKFTAMNFDRHVFDFWLPSIILGNVSACGAKIEITEWNLDSDFVNMLFDQLNRNFNAYENNSNFKSDLIIGITGNVWKNRKTLHRSDMDEFRKFFRYEIDNDSGRTVWHLKDSEQ